jgi:hypothetical protein
VCTVINEMIATLLQLRASNLEAGLTKMIDDPTLRSAFGTHGIMQSARATAGDKTPSYLSGEAFAMAVLGSLNTRKAVPGFSDFENAISALPASRIRDALLAQVVTAEGKVDQLRGNVARWFDDSMDRVTGVYKRQLKVIGLLVAMAVAIGFNADVVRVATLLWHDSSLRAEVAAGGTQLIASVAQSVSHENKQNGGASQAPGSPDSSSKPVTPTSLTASQLQEAENELRPLPIGWTRSEWSEYQHDIRRHIAAKAAGILVTILAISLGAPFWFDLLSKVSNLRGAGEKPARSS